MPRGLDVATELRNIVAWFRGVRPSRGEQDFERCLVAAIVHNAEQDELDV
jgi:hypothetical protein